ncbi:hypothetical protein K0U00_41925, partial [Paenibacillus sepulcri]|nr:hypothetical protein [Paenibacillus sepulcri]
MKSAVVVHPNFDTVWPFAANHLHRMWSSQGDTQLIRLLTGGEEKLGEVVPSPAEIARLAVLGVDITRDCLGAFTSLKEAAICTDGYNEELEPEIRDAWERAGVQIYKHPSEGFWGQSVSEFGLALTLCGLRRIPQSHHAIISSLAPWDYNPPGNMGMPETRGHQFGDDPNFTNGTVFGKKVRIVGAGNIASRYASFVSMLGAEAAAWDPFA